MDMSRSLYLVTKFFNKVLLVIFLLFFFKIQDVICFYFFFSKNKKKKIIENLVMSCLWHASKVYKIYWSYRCNLIGRDKDIYKLDKLKIDSQKKIC